MAQVAVLEEAEDHALVAEETGLAHVRSVRPAGRAVRTEVVTTARPPGGSPYGDGARQDPPEGGERAGACEDLWRLGVIRQPPREQLPGRVELEAKQVDCRRAERRLERQHRRRPLRGRGEAQEGGSSGEGDLGGGEAERGHGIFPLRADKKTCA